MGPLIGRLGEDTLRDWWATEAFTEAPPPAVGPTSSDDAGQHAPAGVVA
jgi:hypothetical protein